MKVHISDRDTLLIWLYLEISNICNSKQMSLFVIRLSNNQSPIFTDAELFTCATFTELLGYHSKKAGYEYLKAHYHSWFPALPCYEVYSRKLNKFSESIRKLYQVFVRKYNRTNHMPALIDTEPIEVCQPQHSHHAKTAQPFADKGYCAAKRKYYFGAKLQIVAQARENKLPFPYEFALASASFHDLDIAKSTLPYSDFDNSDLYGDLAYQDETFQLELFNEKRIQLITPIKKKKGQHNLFLFQQANNSIHSSIRQPIDTLFGWINKKTGIQDASRVRSVEGLFYHVSIKMLAALILMIVQF